MVAAGELAGFAVEPVGEAEDLGGVVDFGVQLGFGEFPEFEGEADVVADAHVGVEGVVLEDHGDVALLGRLVVGFLAADVEDAAGDVLQPGHHPQRGGLAAAGRADQHHELAVGDVQGQVVHGVEAVLVDLVDLVQAYRGHGYPFTAPEVSPETTDFLKMKTSTPMGTTATTEAAKMVP
jgi:hypothetical protein